MELFFYGGALFSWYPTSEGQYHEQSSWFNSRPGDFDYVFLSATPVLANPGNGNGGGHGNNAANQGNNGNGHKGNAGQKTEHRKMAVNRITSSRTLATLSPCNWQ